MQSLAGYLAIALENAQLYQSLERKAEGFERLRVANIVESINVGILAADLDDRVNWNTQLRRLTGITRAHAVQARKLCGAPRRSLPAPQSGARSEAGVHHILKFKLNTTTAFATTAANGHTSGHSNGNGNTTQRSRPPRAESIVNLAVAPLVSKEFEQIGRLVIFDDITERSALERQLVQADKLSSIGLLAAGVAHEVNTPLAVISSYAQMLAKQVSGDDAASQTPRKDRQADLPRQ
ncbi:MAG: histidine kinase dimerization/phospho-acceptor domain-containing protein [Bryobacteraceae bacterium]